MRKYLEIINYQDVSIPFGNSKFQIENFIANEITPTRALRVVLLQIDQKMNALSDHTFRKKRREIDLKEKTDKIKTTNDQYEKERLQIDIEEINYYAKREEKLLQDCLEELEIYYNILQTLPKINRDEFEKGEYEYWCKRLINDARNELLQGGSIQKGTLESLTKLKINVVKENNQILFISEDRKDIKQLK